jgi:hypothetical protein
LAGAGAGAALLAVPLPRHHAVRPDARARDCAKQGSDAGRRQARALAVESESTPPLRLRFEEAMVLHGAESGIFAAMA